MTDSTAAPEDELPGMLAVAKGIAEQKWPHTMDAAVWAAEFCKMYPGSEFSEGDMIGWFANAIMAGYDTANARRSEKQPTFEEQVDAIAKAPTVAQMASARCVVVPMGAWEAALLALNEAEAILGGEYGDTYGVLCETMCKLESALAAAPVSPDTNRNDG